MIRICEVYLDDDEDEDLLRRFGEGDLVLFRAGDFLSGVLEEDEDVELERERYGRLAGDRLGDLLKGDLRRGERRGEPRGYHGDLRRLGEGPRRHDLRTGPPTGECLGLVGLAGKVFCTVILLPSICPLLK